MRTRGISPVVSIIILIMITVVLLFIVFMFFNDISEMFRTSLQNQSSAQVHAREEKFRIDGFDNQNLTIKNTGTVEVSELNVYINDEPISYQSIPAIMPGQSAVLRLDPVQMKDYPECIERKIRVSSAYKSTEVIDEPVNLVPNPSFELGSGVDAYNWTEAGGGAIVNRSSDIAHTGLHSMKVNTTFGFVARPHADAIYGPAGKTFLLSGWVFYNRTGPGENPRLYLNVAQRGDESPCATRYTYNGTSDEWVYLSCEFSEPEPGTPFYWAELVLFNYNFDGNAAYFDDIGLYQC